MSYLPNNPPQEPDVITGRFSGAEWFNTIRNFKIFVAGAGGIGSWTSLILSRFSPSSLAVTDPDRFERINMSGQFCDIEDIGRYKSQALHSTIIRFSRFFTNILTQRIEDVSLRGYDILVCGFDNMEARKNAFKKFMNTDSLKFFIDGRLSFSRFQIYAFSKQDDALIEKYEREALFEDSEAEQTVCTMKQTSFLADMISSMIANYIANYAANLSESTTIEHAVPYFTEYNSVLAQLTTEL